MHQNYVQMPPDGVGKKIQTKRTYVIPVSTTIGLTTDVDIQNQLGIVLHIKELNSFSNLLYCMYKSDLNDGGSVNVGDSIYLSSNPGVEVCKVQAGTTILTPEFYNTNLGMQVSYDNTFHGQIIDAQGQAYTRFAEGSPSLDAFGNLRTSSAISLGAYEFTNGDMIDLFQDKTLTGGTVTYDPIRKMASLTTTSTNGSSATRSTNRYHYYQPGIGNLIILTLSHSDIGQSNNVRRWGYFDTDNGIFFELDGTSLSVVIRSKTSGIISERRITRTNWNGDKLDGTGKSKMNLALIKANFFFIDFAWLGVGCVRCGVLAPDGSRWVCHKFENPNANIHPYMQTGSLPIRFENYNTNTTGSTSELNSICTAVFAESQTNYTFWRFSDIERSPIPITTNTPILSMTPVSGSRVGLYPSEISVYVSGGAVKLSIIDDGILTGATWGIIGQGSAIGDITASAITGGELFKTFYANSGVTNILLSDVYETTDEGYHRLADDTAGYTFTLVATKLDGTTVNVGATLSYKELR
jgi:hypothetical protein